MSDTPRTIDLSIEVHGTPEEVWRAIATGPGISSWYVPHRVEERAGGAARASFGPGPEMQVDGRVAAWEPPHRVVFDDGQDAGGLAFEWLIEARHGGSCVVRLVGTGFGDGGQKRAGSCSCSTCGCTWNTSAGGRPPRRCRSACGRRTRRRHGTPSPAR